MRHRYWFESVSRFYRLPAVAILSLTLLGACSSSKTEDGVAAEVSAQTTAETTAETTAAETTATEASDASDTSVSNPSVSVVEVEPETAETVVAATPGPDDDPNAANPNFPVEATPSVQQAVAACTPLAEAYQKSAATWLAIKLIAESNLAVGKSFNPEEITNVRTALATLRKAVTADPAATKSVDTMERGFGLILDTSVGKPDAGKKLSDFVKTTPDLAGVPKPIGAALRTQDCIVVDY
jgi:hypothetical protein